MRDANGDPIIIVALVLPPYFSKNSFVSAECWGLMIRGKRRSNCSPEKRPIK
jgi:hypothetical protein